MLQFVGVPLPVLTVKGFDGQVPGSRVEASDIDRETVRVGAGHIKRFYATGFAKQVLCNPGIESIGYKRIFTGEQSEVVPGYDQVNKSRHRADRAVTLVALELLGRLHLEPHGFAMAMALVNQPGLLLARSTDSHAKKWLR
jgi:hypothetical protein